ncbi:MAG TPA: hypothetical protein VHU91_06515, partial [Mycobacteriales bacterium]|nr:hypothetical protein [Mycobacteriales bacterium]
MRWRRRIPFRGDARACSRERRKVTVAGRPPQAFLALTCAVLGRIECRCEVGKVGVTVYFDGPSLKRQDCIVVGREHDVGADRGARGGCRLALRQVQGDLLAAECLVGELSRFFR